MIAHAKARARHPEARASEPIAGRIAEFCVGERRLSVVAVAAHDSSFDTPTTHVELTRFDLSGTAYAILGEREVDDESTHVSPAHILTLRELQIAALVAEGLLNKQVADRLKISEWTVCTHLRRIYAKLQVSTRAAMVYRCAALVSRRPSA